LLQKIGKLFAKKQGIRRDKKRAEETPSELTSSRCISILRTVVKNVTEQSGKIVNVKKRSRQDHCELTLHQIIYSEYDTTESYQLLNHSNVDHFINEKSNRELNDSSERIIQGD
jgi:hypothetical protein